MQKKCCVAGFPISHSLSPAMHNAGFKELNMDWTYKAIEVPPDKFGDFMQRVKQNEFAGISVTVPYKEEVIKYVNILSPCAESIEAVNTLFFDGERLIGENTDWYGVYCALREVLRFKRRRVIIFGAGGAARACVYALREFNAEIFLTNRTIKKAKKLAKEFHVTFVHPTDLPEADLFINATSVGLNGNDFLLIKEDWLGQTEYVFDMVYTETILQKTAEKMGCKLISGKKMLLHQAAKQFEIWTGEKAPIKTMKQAIAGY